MVDKNRYDVKIGNNNYVLKTKRSKEETDAIVKYVDTELESAKVQLKYRNPAMHATLACLNIADTLYSISKEYDDLKIRAEGPLKDFEPLKLRCEELESRVNNDQQRLSSYQEKINLLEQRNLEVEKERDAYKAELDKNHAELDKYKEQIEFLRNRLIDQENESLQAYKQLQEVLKTSANR